LEKDSLEEESKFERNESQGPESERVSTRNDDYKMRIFTGSESLVREFKHHTPKESRL
jgi:hypothetical protein